MSGSFSDRVPLSRHEIDRDHEARSRAGHFEELWASSDTRILVLWKGLVLLAAGDPHRVKYVAPAEVPSFDLRIYLGLSISETSTSLPSGVAVLAVSVDDDTAEALEPDDALWGNLRDVAMVLDNADAGAFAEALAVVNWHRTHEHCPRCGAATVPAIGGWVRHCGAEDIQIFPRTDPAVIVGIVDEQDRILLGSNAMWGTSRFSLLAGFVEPGESLEAAVIREVYEESGVRVVAPEYLGSQPWPFPASIMLGFLAKAAPGEGGEPLRPDGEEIVELRWFSREELVEARDSIMLPGHLSIARAILERWFGGPIPEPTDPEARW